VFLQLGAAPVLNILMLPILVNELGVVAYGIYATLHAVFVFALFDLGLSKSVVRYTSHFAAKGSTEGVSRFVSTAFTFYLGIGGAMATFAVLFGIYGLGIIQVPERLETDARLACFVFAFAALYNMPMGTLGGVMAGLKRHKSDSMIGVGVAAAQAAGMAVAALGGYGLLGVVVAWHLPNFVKPWIRYPLIRRVLPDFKLSPLLFTKGLVKELSGYSFFAFFIDSGNKVTQSTDPIFIAAFLGPAIVTPYNIGLQAGRLLQRLTLPITFVLLPIASELDARDDRAAVQRMVLRATRYTSGLALGLALPLIIQLDDVIRVWLGNTYPLAVDVGRMFLVVSILLMSRAPLMNVLEGNRRGVRFAGLVALGETIANIALSLALIQVLGARGVALATIIAVGTGTLLGVIPSVIMFYGISPGQFFRRALAPNLVPVLLSLPIWFGAAWLISGAGIVVVVSGLAVSMVAYAVLFWRFLPAADRRDLGPSMIRKTGLRPKGAG
jgi:O-antigen/teichoic acid export membrane protein